MPSIHAVELDWIRHLHTIRTPLLDSIFRFWHYIDSCYFLMLLIPAVWYLANRRLGIQLFYILVISTVVNKCLKYFFGLPRPVQLDSELGLFFLKSHGFPSGAAQTATIVAGLAIREGRNFLHKTLGILFAITLCFSRIYLGVHFLTDVIGGITVGLLLNATFPKIFSYLESIWDQKPKHYKLIVLALLPTLILPTLALPKFKSNITYLTLCLGVGVSILLNERLQIPNRFPRNTRILLALSACCSNALFFLFGSRSTLIVFTAALQMSLILPLFAQIVLKSLYQSQPLAHPLQK